MRPRQLHLEGFGAFPGAEHVDFDALAQLGLFVVTGPTGAGKTTLFDAMAFALYGELPAGRPLAEVRSHHSGPDDRCAVELTFAVEGTSYRVRRTPERTRPKRRGHGTTVDPATAELHRLADDGTETPLVAGNRPVTEACVALVGLDLGQFERVVLLPQGRFQQFLLADTRERRPLLQKLFGTGLYRDAVEELKRRAGELRRQVERVDAEVDRHRLNAKEHLRAVAAGLDDAELDGVEPDDAVELLDAFWQKLAPGVEELQRTSRELAERAAAATRVARDAAALAPRWDQRAELRRRAREAEAVQAELDELRLRVDEALRARRVVDAATARDAAGAQQEAATAEVARARLALGELLAALDLADPAPSSGSAEADPDPDAADRALGVATAELERVAGLVRRRLELRAEAHTAGERLAAVTTARAELADRQGRLAERRLALEARRAVLEPEAELVDARGAAAAAAADRLERRRRLEGARAERARHLEGHRHAEDALAEVLAAFVAGAAPRLAAALRPGEPCPVCGGAEHPRPAPPASVGAVDVAALERAQRQAARRAAESAAASAAVEEQVAALGPDADRPVEELAADHEARRAEARAATRARAELVEVRVGLEQAGAEHDRYQARAAELATEGARLEAALAALAEQLERLDAEVGDADPAALAERGHRLAAATRAVAASRRATATATAARGAVAQAEAALAAELAESGFATLVAARAAARPEVELRRAERRVAAHDALVVEVRNGLATLAEVDLPDDRPDAEGLEAHAAELRADDDALRARLERLLERATQAQASIGRARRAEDAGAGTRDLHERAARVAAVCDGQGPARIGLETWVLAGELERVTEAANVHLARMTAGRYQLQRTDDARHRAKQAGLDLTVVDSHTGRARPPATLSGGEQFQASLALALGLADVVSLGGVGSGRRFEALFVDEGFGSLDPEALDQAVDALHQIHATGRMVGVITHVEAMKQQLPAGVEVHRRPDGRGSTLASA